MATGENFRIARRSGFTMVEIMVVMAIIMMLFSMVLFAAAKYYQKGSISSTEALLIRLEDGLDSYKRLTGHYPPDGFDSEVQNGEKEVIKGSACLYHFLGEEITWVLDAGGEKRIKTHEPLLEFKKQDLIEGDSDRPGVFEIRDAFGFPIHYDNTEDGKFNPQDGSEHILETFREEHPPDPRDSVEFKAVKEEGPQGKRGYDLWSYGTGKHTEKEDLKSVIASWTLGRKKD
ncbi:MAG: type II secretion system protein [Planctomycetes bacterium]|nr:type II secretion system protein [Planctomycetota bacterium]